MEDYLWPKTSFDGRRPLMENDLRRKTKFDRTQPLMEDTLWGKTTFEGRRPLTEDDFWWRTPLIEDGLWWRMSFNGWRSLMEENIQLKITFDGRRLWTEDDFWWCSVRRSVRHSVSRAEMLVHLKNPEVKGLTLSLKVWHDWHHAFLKALIDRPNSFQDFLSECWPDSIQGPVSLSVSLSTCQPIRSSYIVKVKWCSRVL